MLTKFWLWLTTRTPGLPRRNIPDIQGPKEDILPQRKEIWVTCEVRRFDPLAQVRKGWGKKLKLLVSQYLAGKFTNYDRWRKQALQTCLHEMMHIALWDDKSIIHSTSDKSLLFEYIDGSIQEPCEWDLRVMKEAADRIEKITIDGTKIYEYQLWPVLKNAVRLWNEWIGRELFVLLPYE